MKKTALYDQHVALGGKIIDFGGWALPVQFKGIIEEHLTVRRRAGLFDVSHMGEILVEGPDALDFVQYLVTADVARAAAGQVVYSPMCYEDGGVVDDLLVYKYSQEKLLLVVNAANAAKDWAWINEQKRGEVTLSDLSCETAQIALQGPRSQKILAKLSDADLDALGFYHFYPQVEVAGLSVLLSRTGYTGEDGFEFYLPNAQAESLWLSLLEAGREEGLEPVGLGARDTLRFEAALPLYGQEISREINPLEAGLGFFVSADKGDYLGREALAKVRAEGLKRRLAGFVMVGRGVARSHFPVEKDGREIGFVTTGSYAPSLGQNFGLALVEAPFAKTGESIDVMIRGKAVEAQIIARPFVPKNYKR
ncbi:MAG: glycine cleavage system aminomethyltransferase GcvT [Clostridiales bacterium]|nr:glycine cleavage system aminomethyltransferase GcvT [Clostridiales bacterium]